MLDRFDESLIDELLTDAYTAAEIIEQVRVLGGDPVATGARGLTLGAEVASRARLLHPAQDDPATEEVNQKPASCKEAQEPRSEHLSASPFGGVASSNKDKHLLEEAMNKDFEFKQLLRAYRAGIISPDTFESEMRNLEMGASSPDSGGFKAFGRTYASEREAVIKFLEVVAPAEKAGGDAVRAWLKVCKLDCIKGGLKMVAERESYHGRAFAQRLEELGGTIPQTVPPRIREDIDYLFDTNISDLEKLHKAVMRNPNPEETIRPLFEFAELLKEDQQTKEMVKLFAQDELSTLKWQQSLCTVLTEMQKNGRLAAAA